ARVAARRARAVEARTDTAGRTGTATAGAGRDGGGSTSARSRRHPPAYLPAGGTAPGGGLPTRAPYPSVGARRRAGVWRADTRRNGVGTMEGFVLSAIRTASSGSPASTSVLMRQNRTFVGPKNWSNVSVSPVFSASRAASA